MRIFLVASQLVTLALQLWIIGLLFKKGFVKRFPWFLVFILYQICEGALRSSIYWSRGNDHTYFVAYWVTEPFDVLLSVFALGESFLQIFRPFARLRWFRRLFWSCLVLTVFYWLWQLWVHPPNDTNRLMSLVLRLDLVAVYVPMVVALLYFGLIRLFGISRHQRQSGVILGLGINSLAEFVALVPRWVYGIKTVAFVAWIPPLGYVLAEIIWVIELLRPEPPVDPRLAQLSPKEVNEVLGQYVRVLRTLTKKSK